MKFDLVRPCAHCPFRTDVTPFITAARAREIAHAITDRQMTFSCHETVDDDEQPRVPGRDEQHCAGALILLEHMNRPNQMMRWMERIHFYDRTKLQMDAKVYRTTHAFIAAHARARKSRRTK